MKIVIFWECPKCKREQLTMHTEGWATRSLYRPFCNDLHEHQTMKVVEVHEIHAATATG